MTDSLATLWELPAGPSRWPLLHGPTTHVWRIPLNGNASAHQYFAHLSGDEQQRVHRFYFQHHAARFAAAHSALRQILAAYDGHHPLDLEFASGDHGKPHLIRAPDVAPLHFNLSHSGDMALVAVSRHSAVGVDVEQWRDRVQHLEIAERFFSPYERDALLTLPRDSPANDAILRGFFSTWSRKEAYLKASGHGISRGLHHFDVTMERVPEMVPENSQGLSREEPTPVEAQLLADRLDPGAVARWAMSHIHVAQGYSAAVVTARAPDGTPGAVRLFDSPYI